MAFNFKKQGQQIRKERIRKKIFGTSERPRMTVFRSARYVYVQVIDDVSGQTLVTCSSLDKNINAKQKKISPKELAKEIGKKLAERAKTKNISQVVFDRNGYDYHGRIQALAEGAREGGLHF